MKATRPLAVPLSPDDWLDDFQAALTASLGGKVIRADPDTAWQSGNHVVRCSIVATTPPVVCMIAVEVSHGIEEPPDLRFVFRPRDDPFASAQIVASWLYGKRTSYKSV